MEGRDNISGATTDTLIISPASAADVTSGANGYFAAVTGPGNFTTNSAKAALTLRTATNLIWNASSTAWDLNNAANWQDINATQTTFNYGDSATFDTTSPLRIVQLTGKYLAASSVTVNNDIGTPYTFLSSSTGGFAGPGKMLHKGSGNINIANVNTYTGGTILSNASAVLTLQRYDGIGSGGVTFAKAGATMEITLAGSSTTGLAGDVNIQDDGTIQLDGTGSFATVLNGNVIGTASKTLTFNVNPTNTTIISRIRAQGTNTLCNANINLNSSVLLFASYDGGASHIYNGVISGSGSYMQKAGVTFLNAANTYSGGSLLVGGTIALGLNSTGAVTDGPIGTGPLLLTIDSTTTTTGSGTVFASGGARTIANPIQYPTGTNNLTLIFGGTNNLTFSGAMTLNGNDNVTTNTITARTVQTTNTGLSTLSGIISDGGLAYGFIKTGNGDLNLSAANTFSGGTSVSNGTLRVNGSLAGGAVTVATNAALGGTGTINGPVTVLAGGSINPGNSIGTINLNSLILSGNLGIEVNRAGSLSDKAIVTGILTNTSAGVVNVTNLGAAFQAGDTFTLFNKALTNGNAMTITGGGASVTWTNKLAINGTISVLSVTSTTPTNITSSVSGNNLTLSWPSSHLSWTLQSNIVGVTSSANWFPVAGSTATNSMTFTINPARSNVFYRMTYP